MWNWQLRTIALIQPQMAQKSLQLETDLQPCPENLLVDPNRMQQVFANLLTNATQFTPDGGQIAATLTYSAAQIHSGLTHLDDFRGRSAPPKIVQMRKSWLASKIKRVIVLPQSGSTITLLLEQ